MRIAIYPGSFDPITSGHVDIIRRVRPIFDKLIVVASHSQEKSYLFSLEERKSLIEQSLRGICDVEVDYHDGLTVDYVKNKGAQVIIRGLRAISDFEYELVMANMNKKLAPDIETLIVFANPDYHYVSSRAIKEVALLGGRLTDFVPVPVVQAMATKLSKRGKK